MRRLRLSLREASLATLIGIFMLATVAVSTASEAVLHSFQSTNDGVEPHAGLVADKAGNLYGTTFWGGAGNWGMVFQLSPPAVKGSAWTETILHSFSLSLTDGVGPSGGLILDSSGNIYGTTWLGGPSGGGVVFELSPPASGGEWTETILYDFSKLTVGSSPEASLTFDKAGNLYGTTSTGGVGGCGCGTVFQLQPASQGSMWTVNVLYTFPGSLFGGGGTRAGVTISGGKVYGTSVITASNAGTVFRLTPPAKLGGAWKHDVLYTFLGGSSDGANPWSNVVFDSKGNLYGATQLGGVGNCVGETCGTIYKLTPAASLPWTETILYTFAGGSDGGEPNSSVIIDKAGNLFGTAGLGGDFTCSTDGCGTVFKLTPPANGTGAWTKTTVHVFSGGSDGANPIGNITFGMGGLFYGTTFQGGTGSCTLGCGAVFSTTH
jgi:uncharacterized repeat protein (TIGR03803 family)